MTIIDRTQFQRQTAIVDMIRSMPTMLSWHAVSELPVESQNALYDLLRAVEPNPCEMCGGELGDDDIELCDECGHVADDIEKLQDLMNASGVVFGEKL